MEKNKKIILILVVLVILGILGALIYKKKQNKINNISNIQPAEETGAPAVVVDKAKQEEFEEALKNIATADQDFDGLPDNQELNYKTDPTSADTDGDGLTDWQEVSIYTSDPLKSDTDGDTFTDGYEVRRGFSPKGTGKL